jgi:sugar diacid utilization regulator
MEATGNPVHAGLLDLIRRADRTRDGRAQVVVDQCLSQLPHYQGLPEAMLAEVRDSVRSHLALFYCVTLETGRPLTDADLEYSRKIARQRASQGVPLGEFLTFFHVGLGIAWQDLMQSVGDDPNLRAGLLERVEAVIGNQQLLMTALTEAYVQERERLSRFREQDVDDFVQLLLADEAMESVVQARARALGIRAGEPLSVVVFAPPAAAASEGANVAPDDLRRRLIALDPGAEPLVGRAREGFVALLRPDPDPKGLSMVADALFGADARVGIGGAARGVAEARRSAQEAVRALEIGTRADMRQWVHRYPDLAVLDLVGAGSPKARRFAHDVVGALAAAPGGVTQLETLRQLARVGFRHKLAAAALSVHPHTLAYRVKQLRARHGIDLDDPETRLRVELALRILDAQGPGTGSVAECKRPQAARSGPKAHPPRGPRLALCPRAA